MEYISKDKLAEVVKSYYSKGMTYKEMMNYISRVFLLSREDRIWCKDVLRGCENAIGDNQ